MFCGPVMTAAAGGFNILTKWSELSFGQHISAQISENLIKIFKQEVSHSNCSFTLLTAQFEPI